MIPNGDKDLKSNLCEIMLPEKMKFKQEIQWNRLGFEMVTSLVINGESENSDRKRYSCFFFESSCY